MQYALYGIRIRILEMGFPEISYTATLSYHNYIYQRLLVKFNNKNISDDGLIISWSYVIFVLFRESFLLFYKRNGCEQEKS